MGTICSHSTPKNTQESGTEIRRIYRRISIPPQSTFCYGSPKEYIQENIISRCPRRGSSGEAAPFLTGSRAGKKFEKNRGFMKKGLSKKQRETTVYFTEADSVIEVQTHNTSLKKRLAAYAALYPQCCRQTDEDGQGGLTFEIEKGRLSFRLTAPYSEERKEAASVYARRNSLGNLPNVSDV